LKWLIIEEIVVINNYSNCQKKLRPERMYYKLVDLNMFIRNCA